LYANMNDFPIFRSLSLLYFAAASYAETARRLGKPHLANSFLLNQDPVFGLESRNILEQAQAQQHSDAAKKISLQERIYRLIEQFDVAGLSKRPTNHCYPVEAADLFASAHKLEAGATDIQRLLERTGFYSASS
jgi:tetracycline 7-halogenase / FADH2 O2-dependent halogenase